MPNVLQIATAQDGSPTDQPVEKFDSRHSLKLNAMSSFSVESARRLARQAWALE